MEGNIGFIGELAGEITGEGGGGVTPHVTATAQVDANTGTPTVTVTRTGTDENPNFNFAFQNLKGETGAQGTQGIQGLPGAQGPTGPQGPRGFTGATGATGAQGPAGDSPIVTASATVDNTTGTPSVSVTKTGSELFPNFAFEFHNLKGPTGATGSQGPAGETGPAGPAGPGLASGGSVGQILYKNGAADYLTDWEDLTADKVAYDNTTSGLTATDAQGAIDEVNSSLAQLDGQISTAKFGIDSGNKTSYSFTNLHNLDNQGIYKHALVFIGAGPTQTTLYAVYINEHNTNVAFINLSSNTGRTLTGSVSGTTLTITTDSTCYGGLKLIWLT